MAVSIHNNIVSGPEERGIPAHLSFGQFLFDKLKNGGDKIAQVRLATFTIYKILLPFYAWIIFSVL